MIFENIKNTKDYSGLNKNFRKAFEFLKNNNLRDLEVGKHNIEGEEVFALIQEYITQSQEEKRWESHEKYIDIQMVIEGEELMGFASIDHLEENEDLRKEKDLIFYEETSDGFYIKVRSGDYAIFFPEDGHKPGCSIDKSSKIKKVVVKISCE